MAKENSFLIKKNIDSEELAKFEKLAGTWWDQEGDFKPLHDINPTRTKYISDNSTIQNARVLDVGCGGGILTEALVELGANVTGIDMSEKPLEVARLHALQSGKEIDYLETTAEELSEIGLPSFDIVTCLEMLEHVPDYTSTVEACSRLVRKGGDVFFSTINRNPKAYALAVLGAEYILGLLPKGTHNYMKFIRPAELAIAAESSGLLVKEIIGFRYNPFTRNCQLTSDVDVNYLIHAKKL